MAISDFQCVFRGVCVNTYISIYTHVCGEKVKEVRREGRVEGRKNGKEFQHIFSNSSSYMTDSETCT